MVYHLYIDALGRKTHQAAKFLLFKIIERLWAIKCSCACRRIYDFYATPCVLLKADEIIVNKKLHIAFRVKIVSVKCRLWVQTCHQQCHISSHS